VRERAPDEEEARLLGKGWSLRRLTHSFLAHGEEQVTDQGAKRYLQDEQGAI